MKPPKTIKAAPATPPPLASLPRPKRQTITFLIDTDYDLGDVRVIGEMERQLLGYTNLIDPARFLEFGDA